LKGGSQALKSDWHEDWSQQLDREELEPWNRVEEECCKPPSRGAQSMAKATKFCHKCQKRGHNELRCSLKATAPLQARPQTDTKERLHMFRHAPPGEVWVNLSPYKRHPRCEGEGKGQGSLFHPRGASATTQKDETTNSEEVEHRVSRTGVGEKGLTKTHEAEGKSENWLNEGERRSPTAFGHGADPRGHGRKRHKRDNDIRMQCMSFSPYLAIMS